jgi:NADH-quinone oxidoreductase subunit C
MIPSENLHTKITTKFHDANFQEALEMPAVSVSKKDFPKLMTFLKNDPELSFDYLTDVTGVDYLKQERDPRFDLVYHLYSFKNNQRLRVKLGVPDEDLDVPTMSELWKAALWLEREAFEMFGFNFAGHPDLRRLLLPDVFDGFPLRKDYPLRGRGERDVILDLK